MPCAYDPNDELVRVDDQGVAAASGAHRVHRSIEEPVRELVSAARAAGFKLRIESAFRSYDEQDQLFKRIKQIGRAARPGHSEHQLGTAVDVLDPGVGELTPEFALTPAGQWIAAHAHEYGFVVSYPEAAHDVTCYEFEPWHLRYVGRDNAAAIHESGLTPREWMYASRANAAG